MLLTLEHGNGENYYTSYIECSNGTTYRFDIIDLLVNKYIKVTPLHMDNIIYYFLGLIFEKRNEIIPFYHEEMLKEGIEQTEEDVREMLSSIIIDDISDQDEDNIVETTLDKIYNDHFMLLETTGMNAASLSKNDFNHYKYLLSIMQIVKSS